MFRLIWYWGQSQSDVAIKYLVFEDEHPVFSQKTYYLQESSSSMFTKYTYQKEKKNKILMRLQIGFGPNIIRLDTSRMSMSEKTLKSKIKNPFCSIQLKIALNFFHWLCTCKNKFWIYEKLYVIMQT